MQLILLYLAILPSIVFGFYIYKQDKIEKEPTSLLLKTFLSGVVAGVIVIFLSLIFKIPSYNYDTPIETLFYSFVLVAFLEETIKFILFYLTCYRRKEFNYNYDGIVYASFLSLGFATYENILYVFTMQNIETAIYRGVLTVPAHVFFAIFMGYYFAKAKHYRRYNSKTKEKRFLSFALIIPIVLHGFFDYALLTKSILGLIFFLIFIFVLYITSFKKVKETSDTDKHI